MNGFLSYQIRYVLKCGCGRSINLLGVYKGASAASSTLLLMIWNYHLLMKAPGSGSFPSEVLKWVCLN